MEQAIDLAKNTSPGPNGIPFKAYKILKTLCIPILLLVIKDLMNPYGFPVPRDFNLAILHLLAKKPSSHANGIPAYTPENTRPISVVNTDNRLIASTFNIIMAPKANEHCHFSQRGFLLGRSIIKNILDIDFATQVA